MLGRRIVVGVTGASGILYAHLFLQKLLELKDQYERVDLIFSDSAHAVWKFELPDEAMDQYPFKIHKASNFWAPMASGSAGFDTMVIIPCTMGTLGRIASGQASDLITRAADVMLKERGRLIMVTRESPLSLIHIRNMETITMAGGVICDANPSFYSKPETIEELAGTVVERVIKLTALESKGFEWGIGAGED
ncbi:MAG: UbiX family flavin prenyltransferase [Bacteroidetes bacterium]|nr:UbiX family flavin prenyltransferase [Bacteroidota bacterium]